MDPDDSFEARLRALADQVAQSISETDVDEMAGRLGLDPERLRGMTGALEGWLGGRRGERDPQFDDAPWSPRGPGAADVTPDPPSAPAPAPSAGPHPLDLPGDAQGRTLAALDSGRWTLRPGSGRLSGEGPAPDPEHDPSAGDIVGELRARDWVTAEGAVTLVGRQALLRWCATAAAAAAAEADQAGSAPAGTDSA